MSVRTKQDGNALRFLSSPAFLAFDEQRRRGTQCVKQTAAAAAAAAAALSTLALSFSPLLTSPRRRTYK